MSRASTLILLGILTILTPFSGLPIAMRSTLLVIFGTCIFGIGLSLRIQQARRAQVSAEVSTAESTNFSSDVLQRDSQSGDNQKSTLTM